jgi:hypothetical protein
MDQRFDGMEQKFDGLERKVDSLAKDMPRIVSKTMREVLRGRGRKKR